LLTAITYLLKNPQQVIPAYPYVVQEEIFWQRNNVPEPLSGAFIKHPFVKAKRKKLYFNQLQNVEHVD